jgi:DNA-binding NtrC family response regulator
MNRQLVILSSDSETVSNIRKALEPLCCGITVKQRLSSCLKAIKGSELILLDLSDKDTSVLNEIKSYHPEALVLVIVSDGCSTKAYEDGALCCLEKPVDLLELKVTVRNAFTLMELRQEVGMLRSAEVPKLIVGKNLKMLKVLKQIEKAAAKDTPVLISGEEGTGKEVVAKAIHFTSARKTGRFVLVENSDRLEEELFGKISDRGVLPGKIINAEGGTLFLKECDKMTPEFRKKLSRFIKDKQFSPVNGTEETKADVRVICAVSSIEKEDPFCRNFPQEIKLPPLRQRREDIIPLAEHFLKMSEKTFYEGPKSLSKDAKKALLEYHWPGNVSELKKTIRKAYVLSRNNIIEDHHLAFEDGSSSYSIKEFLEDKLKKYIKEMTKLGSSGIYDTVVSEVEKALIELVLKETGGNQIKAAKTLGINRNTLRMKIKNYKIKNPF